MKIKILQRRILHLWKSGCVVIGIEHFLVMFPSAMLIARLANTAWGSVIELPDVLFACGFGTLIFSLLTKKAIPFFLGHSFSYIGFMSYQVAQISSPNDIVGVRATIFYGYVFAGIILLILSWLYRYGKVKKCIDTLFPSTIMGPAISLIGLELANMAALDSGFTGGTWDAKVLAIITLGCIVVFSLLRHHFLQNASILLGVIAGCVVATLMGVVVWPDAADAKLVLPKIYFSNILHFPPNWLTLALAVFPCAIIIFIESLGRLAVFEGMLRRDEVKYDEKMPYRALIIHSLTTILTSLISVVPSAVYAENLAIMNLHSAELSTKPKLNEVEEDAFVLHCYSNYSIYPYVIASLISILVALFSGLQDVFLCIPMPILGGMELFVFGLISAPGIQMLVDQQVNYKKISNQMITASVFLAGISQIEITYKSLSLHGMSLGLTIGVVVNLIALLLSHLGYLNEQFSISEIMGECADVFSGKTVLKISHDGKEHKSGELETRDLKEYIKRNDITRLASKATRIEFYDVISKKRIILKHKNGRIDLGVSLPARFKNMMINDNPHITAISTVNDLSIAVDEHLSRRLLREILKNAK